MSVCVRERERECVCERMCVCLRESLQQGYAVCVCVRERESVCVFVFERVLAAGLCSVCVCERDTE